MTGHPLLWPSLLEYDQQGVTAITLDRDLVHTPHPDHAEEEAAGALPRSGALCVQRRSHFRARPRSGA